MRERGGPLGRIASMLPALMAGRDDQRHCNPADDRRAPTPPALQARKGPRCGCGSCRRAWSWTGATALAASC